MIASARTIALLALAMATTLNPRAEPDSAGGEAIIAAVERDPRVHAARSRLEAARHALRQVEAGAFPRIELDARQGYRENRDYERRIDPLQNGAERQIALRATQDFDFHGQRSALAREAQARVDESRHQLRLAAHEVAAEVAQAQVEAHYASRLARTQEQLLQFLQDALSKTRELVRLNQADKTAVVSVRQEILAAQAELFRFEAEQRNANARLTALSRLGNAHMTLPIVLAYDVRAAARELAANPGNAPAIAVAQAMLDQAIARHDAARAETEPKWRVEAEMSRGRFNRARERDASIHLYVNYTIFDGGVLRARASQTLSDMRAAQSALDHAKLDAQRRVDDALGRLHLLEELRSGIRDTTQLASENLQDTRELVEIRRLSGLHLIRAQVSLVRSHIQFDNNSLQQHIAVLQILRATGALERAAGLYLGQLGP